VKNGNLSTAVDALEIVTANGDVIHLSKKDGEKFYAAVVGLGAIGVITKVTLNIQPAFEMRQYVYEYLPLQNLKEHFDAIVSAGYSVSLFTDWQKESINEVWIKSRTDDAKNAAVMPDLFRSNTSNKKSSPDKGTRCRSTALIKWVCPVRGTNACLISKWVLHQAVVKSCRQNISFHTITRSKL
jgi:xylitol oxidase